MDFTTENRNEFDGKWKSVALFRENKKVRAAGIILPGEYDLGTATETSKIEVIEGILVVDDGISNKVYAHTDAKSCKIETGAKFIIKVYDNPVSFIQIFI